MLTFLSFIIKKTKNENDKNLPFLTRQKCTSFTPPGTFKVKCCRHGRIKGLAKGTEVTPLFL